ncbi:MAG: tetrathionate reductase family octaheme c-type cytochrome, partial [Gammaproteobacteria bacterium]|nr:tetrathionate reductase family octaheme c-type cytochrome [Gammaproteobacteria bacterium]
GDADEDINGDGTVDVFDCNAYASGAYAIDQLHAGYFTEHPYEGTRSCLNCHGKLADEVLQTAHFKWEGIATNLEGVETEIHGKNDILNNFCIAVPSNEGRCTQCHAGYNYRDDTYDFGDPENIDCLVCHDQTATYAKAPTTAGLPDPTVDLGAVARSVAMNGGQPTIENCIDCHANAGGGDNVKHGDISMSMADTTREYDVHMGTDGGNMECVACHQVQRDADGNMLSHGIGGMPYHSVDEGVMRQCDDCHGDLNNIHIGTTVELVFSNNRHQRLACQVCHIPTFARNTSTKVEWYWETAGQVIDPIPVDPATGRPTYDQKKGDFVWANNVRPELRFFNGKYRKMLIGDNNDTYVAEPVTLAEPMGDYTDPAAMIYPFKRMIGNQVADVVNQRIMVPHLFGMSGGPNPYWARYDWDLALLDASAITGQPYQSGDYGFVDTEMFLSINHEVAPAEQAWGMDANCGDCHLSGQIDWAALGWTNDPAIDGVRP